MCGLCKVFHGKDAETSADKALELGTPNAIQMICCMDKEYMNGFRGVDYKRTKSVAKGVFR